MSSTREIIEQYKRRLEAAGVVFEATVSADYQPYLCETCRDLGVVSYNVPVGDPLFSKTFECPNPACDKAQQNREARFKRLSTVSQLPKDYQQWTFGRWKPLLGDKNKRIPQDERLAGKMEALAAAWAFASQYTEVHYFTLDEAFSVWDFKKPDNLPDTRKNSLMLQGKPGVGKTSLLAAAVNYLLENGQVVVYGRASDILNAVKERYDRQQQAGYQFDYGNTPEAVKALFKRAPVLALDEFNLSAPTDHERGIMEDIIRYRMMNNLPTLMTCNIGFDRFNDPIKGWDYRTGHAVQGMAHWIVMGGPELRPRNQPIGGQTTTQKG